MRTQLKLFVLNKPSLPKLDYDIHIFDSGTLIGVTYQVDSEELRTITEIVTRHGASQLFLVPRYFCNLLKISREIKRIHIRNIELIIPTEEDIHRHLYEYQRDGFDNGLSDLLYDNGVFSMSAYYGDTIITFYRNGQVHLTGDGPIFNDLDELISKMVLQ